MGGGGFPTHDHSWKKNRTLSVNRRKIMLHREKSYACTCPKKNSTPPQKFNGPLLSNVNNNSDVKVSGTSSKTSVAVR